MASGDFSLCTWLVGILQELSDEEVSTMPAESVCLQRKSTTTLGEALIQRPPLVLVEFSR
ncbi:hypothetical protein BTR22_01820 [Alkalihalophilus pseudofirmus]|nr:hypothetical protein BTR22_01820 [Alkalihalophilus pseudofirmus]